MPKTWYPIHIMPTAAWHTIPESFTWLTQGGVVVEIFSCCLVLRWYHQETWLMLLEVFCCTCCNQSYVHVSSHDVWGLRIEWSTLESIKMFIVQDKACNFTEDDIHMCKKSFNSTNELFCKAHAYNSYKNTIIHSGFSVFLRNVTAIMSLLRTHTKSSIPLIPFF